MLLAVPIASSQTDRIYFPAVENVTRALVSAIQAETVRIDMSAWYLTEHSISIALVDAFNRGVPIRLIGDRGSIFEIDTRTKAEFYWLASHGIPIRLRYHPTWSPEIQHWKATIFKGQGLVAFGSANYTPSQLAPDSPTNYSDETVLFTSDPVLVNAFLTRFDVIWNDTTREPASRVGPPYLRNWNQACASESACRDYRTLYPNPAPMSVNTERLEPDHPTPPDLIWSQGPEFNARLVQEIQNESSLVRFVIYRLTASDVADALLARFRVGVPVQLIVEPDEYLNRKWPEFWLTHANIDRLWAAGVPIKQRTHTGLTHMKMLVTSRYATNASSNVAANWQRDANYFVSASAKPAVHASMADRFAAMWNDGAGFSDFVPRPPATPALLAPLPGASVPQTPRLAWRAAPFATSYDVYLGSSPGSLSLAGTVAAQLVNDPPATYSWTPPTALADGVAYHWKVVARTEATTRDPSLVAHSITQSFNTDGPGQPPPPATGGPGQPPPRRRAAGDFDGDGRSDLAVWRPSTGTWWIGRSAAGYASSDAIQWGDDSLGDVPVPGDFDGDGRLDPAVWRPTDGTWYVLRSRDAYASYLLVQWGVEGDVPVPADYDGDGLTDPAVWRRATGEWFVLKSGDQLSAGTHLRRQWGLDAQGDVPVPGDYDGDGRADMAVWRPADGVWYILTSSSGYLAHQSPQWGEPGDRVVPADYDGDGRVDIAVWRPANGTWYCHLSQGGGTTHLSRQWGLPGDVPIPGDYDGDGRADLAVWRPSSGVWYVLESSQGYNGHSAWTWGTSLDRVAGAR
jgi:hypothetical protein